MTRVLVGLIGLLLLPSGCADTAGRELRVADAEQHQIEREIAAREYRASESDTGLQAPNRAHNLRTYFSSAGIRVHDRTAQGSPELVRLALVGIGRGEEAASVPAGEEVVASGHRVEIRRPGIVEWYVNSAEGLEQGFTLAERPAGDGALVLEVAVAGAQASLHGDAVVLDTTAHRRLRYGELLAIDARGTEVPARFALSAPDRLRIVVEDAGAVYPLVIDPLLTELASHAHLERDQAGAEFGYSAAPAGDVNGDGYDDVIVGARSYDAGQTDEGAAFVFLGSEDGIADAALPATQLESDQVDARFGGSVASAGDVNGDGYDDVIVAAPSYDVAPSFQSASFVFLGSASGIANAAAASAATQLAGVGASVASAGDVNGDGYADVIAGGGGAFVFHGSAAGVASGSPATAATRIIPGFSDYALGGSVASAGDVNGDGYADVIVGDASYSGDVNLEGAAYIFLGSAAGVADGTPATAATRIESNSLQAFLGVSVASAGDVNGDGYADVIVGAVNMYVDGGGMAFVFHGSASGIAHGTTSTASASLWYDFLGAPPFASVASAGDVNGDGYADVIVGSPSDDEGVTDGGAAFVFLGGASGVGNHTVQTADTRILSHQGSASLGRSVASAGDVNGDGYSDILVGAPYYDSAPVDEGAAFVFLGSATGIVDSGPPPLAIESVQLEGDQANGSFGTSVASAGDVNADGYADVIVGATRYDAGETDEGAAFVFLGSAQGIGAGTPLTADTQLESNQAAVSGQTSRFGESVASAGDVNGDGYGDVIVGAPRYDAGQNDEGAGFVFLGSASGIPDGNPTTADSQLESNQIGALLGTSVASAGDVNGDGFDDVIAGANQYDNGQSNEGAAFVFHGSVSGIADGQPATAATRLEGAQISASFGLSVDGAGDVNGDGFGDVIVGAGLYDAGQLNEGAAFIFLGSASGIAHGDATTAAAQLESNQDDSQFGTSVATAGDVNGDGFADVITGAYLHDAGLSQEGGAFVFLGSASGIADGNPSTAATRLVAEQEHALLGLSVKSAGDWNGDGFGDVIVGATDYDVDGLEDAGAAFVFLGSASGIPDGDPSTAAVTVASNQEFSYFGQSVATAGDVNGDGRAEVIVGGPLSDAGQTLEGIARVVPEPTGWLAVASGYALLVALACARRRRA